MFFRRFEIFFKNFFNHLTITYLQNATKKPNLSVWQFLVAHPGLEPGTPRLKVLCSTN